MGRREKRLRIFFDFWKAVRTVYAVAWDEAIAAASEGSRKAQILKKVALLTLQGLSGSIYDGTSLYVRKLVTTLSGEKSTKEMVSSTLKIFHQNSSYAGMEDETNGHFGGARNLVRGDVKGMGQSGPKRGNLRLFRS